MSMHYVELKIWKTPEDLQTEISLGWSDSMLMVVVPTLKMVPEGRAWSNKN